MSEPYVGEIRLLAFNFPPAGWLQCDGALLAISEYETLFNLIGTTYGGDGQNTFAVPDLRSLVPIHMGQGSGLSSYVIGQTGGVESVTLTSNQIPAHNHSVAANSSPANNADPGGAFPASGSAAGGNNYSKTTDAATMNSSMVAPAGGSQPHTNIQPYLVINFCISAFGIFPTQS
jgi:microcystin-dependent protein